MKNILSVILLLVSSLEIKAQDFIFSQFGNTTIMINPAITGNYLGLVRTTLNQRVQQFGYGTPFNTSILTVDKSIRSQAIKNDRISYGAYIVRDGAMSGDRIELRQYSASLAYHKLVAKKKYKHQFFSFGAQFGSATRSVMTSNFIFDSQITKDGYDPNLHNPERFFREDISYGTLNAGVLYTFTDSSFKKPVVKFTAGYGAFNIVSPVEAVTSINYQRLGIRHHFNSSLVYWFVGTKLFLKQDLLFSIQGNAFQVKSRTIFDYWYNRKYAFLFGVNVTAGRYYGPEFGLGIRNMNLIYSMDFGRSNSLDPWYTANELTLIYLNPMPGREKVYALRAGDARM